MNKKGFTLTELLAVIAIIAIVSLVAVPNIVNISDNSKSNKLLSDAKLFISLAKLEVNSNYSIREQDEETFYIGDLNKSGEFKVEVIDNVKGIVDPDNGLYDSSSYVKYEKNNGTPRYCIYLISSKRYLAEAGAPSYAYASNASCIYENDLTQSGIVHVK